MNSTEIALLIRYRAIHTESIEQRHKEFVENMCRIGPPLGFKDLEFAPPAPEDPAGNYVVTYGMSYPIRGLNFFGLYQARSANYLRHDKASYDDSIDIRFKASNKALDYQEILHVHFPRVIEAYRGYLSNVSFGYHQVYYEEANPAYKRLREDKTININGRNNIFTLHPAQYWDALLCQKALGYGPEEVMRRLQGKALKVEPLMDGVYIIFNDDKNLSLEEFIAINDHFKPILGLI